MAYLIPPQIYVGFRDRHRYQKTGEKAIYKSGEALPLLGDSGDSNRKESVESYCGSNYDPETWDNEPMEGFRIAFDLHKDSYNITSWRVEDPRGGMFSISSGNLASLMNDTVVAGGLIQGKCVWLRDGAQNSLVLEDSEEYKEAFEQSVARMGRVSLRDVQRGDVVALHDGDIVTFLGLFRVSDYFHNSEDDFVRYFLDFSNIKKRYFYLIHNEEDGTKKLAAKSSVKVGYIKEKVQKPLSDQEAFNLAFAHDNEDPGCSSYFSHLFSFYAPKVFGGYDIEFVYADKEVTNSSDLESNDVLVADIGDPEHLLMTVNNGTNFYSTSNYHDGYLLRKDKLVESILYIKEGQSHYRQPYRRSYSKFQSQDVCFSDYTWHLLRIRLKEEPTFEMPVKLTYI